MKYSFDWKEYGKKARQMAAEGCVLVENDGTLPLEKGLKVALFGRIQFDYYKSGNGSGGLVNTPYVISVPKALRQEGFVLNERLEAEYVKWLEGHPFDNGKGWATEPLCQEEMEISEELVKACANESDVAVIIIGRTAGEDRDSIAGPGGFLLTQVEERMLQNVRAAFEKVVVLMNIGSIMDMSWVKRFGPNAVVIGWQGGSEGGAGLVDVLTGNVNPSGRLADTIAERLEDYPSTANYGDADRNYYEEDIYVGYRYFETAAKDRVIYPFGYGLSYTEFSMESLLLTEGEGADAELTVKTVVTNIGEHTGKEVLQVYYMPPAVKMYGAARNLVSFAKTEETAPGEKAELSAVFKASDMACFDDTGVIEKSARVLEAGEYRIYAGKNVRETEYVGSFTVASDTVVEKLHEACAPARDMKRHVYRKNSEGEFTEETELISGSPLDRTAAMAEKSIKDEFPEYTGDKGIRFVDVLQGRAELGSFLAQIPDRQLICMTRGEGMSSPKVTPGVAGSFGGVTKELSEKYGMPVAACADGPSGIRMDCGTAAMSLPSGTAQACSFNMKLVEELYDFAGQELRRNKVDALLGPGINIHRNPLNGRNFEYYSEDPLLTGKCASAELRAFHRYGVTGTLKHFAGNNQEYRRSFVDAAMSERALREIYLKAFEMAVKEGSATAIMTSYGPLNGVYTCANRGLNTTILREEWGFDGLVMTDWWAQTESEELDTASMIKSGNDVYMVALDAESNYCGDNSDLALSRGTLRRSELLKAAAGICRTLLRLIAATRLSEGEDEITELNTPKMEGVNDVELGKVKLSELDGGRLPLEGICTDARTCNRMIIELDAPGVYDLTMRLEAAGSELSQTSVTVSANKVPYGTVTLNGTGGEVVEKTVRVGCETQYLCFLELYFAQSGIRLENLTFSKHEI